VKNFYLTDLDKTFLKDDLTISKYSIDIWNRLNKSGERISIATARSLTGVKKLLRGVDLKEPLILLDGVVIATIDGKILDMQYLNRDIGDEIIEFSYKNSNIYPLIVGMGDNGEEEFIYPKKMNIYQNRLLTRFHNDKRVLKLYGDFGAIDRNLKIVYLDTKKSTAKLAHVLKAKFGKSIELKRAKDPYLECYFLTILHREGDKANALKKLEKIADIERKDTTVFGDSYNDIGLFKTAGRKVAVANAIEELKSLADIVLPWSNQEDGVMRFLEAELLIR
jgi:Cof subfamily protein (haloacid dehalogenase superfamily)